MGHYHSDALERTPSGWTGVIGRCQIAEWALLRSSSETRMRNTERYPMYRMSMGLVAVVGMIGFGLGSVLGQQPPTGVDLQVLGTVVLTKTVRDTY
jgi:hypothetical protein